MESVNQLSGNNAFVAAKVALATGGLLFIAGGNGGEKGKRGDKQPGSLQEARRMQRYIEMNMSTQLPIVIDTGPEFVERYGFTGSMNTIENARNAALIIAEGGYSVVDLVATRQHLLRCIGTLRRQLMTREIDKQVSIAVHPVTAVFEPNNDQPHLVSLQRFTAWDWASTLHHWLLRQVPFDHLWHVSIGDHYKAMYAFGCERVCQPAPKSSQ
jgi:hypothetical protein